MRITKKSRTRKPRTRKSRTRKPRTRKSRTRKYLGGSLFDVSDTSEQLITLNEMLQKKCPNLEIRVGIMSEMLGKINAYSPKDKNGVLICLYYQNDCIASIQLLKNEDKVELRSFTDETYSGKKYNTLLRLILAMISNRIKLNGTPITILTSYATNPISAHLLMKNYDIAPSMDDTEFEYFVTNLYKQERQPGDIDKIIDEFYKKYKNSVPIDFEIPLTRELVDKSFEKFKLLVGEMNPSEIEKQISCP